MDYWKQTIIIQKQSRRIILQIKTPMNKWILLLIINIIFNAQVKRSLLNGYVIVCFLQIFIMPFLVGG